MNSHTSEEVDLMMSYFDGGKYVGCPRWIFMAALNEWGISSKQLLAEATKATTLLQHNPTNATKGEVDR